MRRFVITLAPPGCAGDETPGSVAQAGFPRWSEGTLNEVCAALVLEPTEGEAS